jgi:hypothetical protein
LILQDKKMLYSKDGSYPNYLPFRIKLSNGLTRTDPTSFTPEEIADAGYITVEDPPSHVPDTQILEWSGTAWNVRDKTEQELGLELERKWQEIRSQRDYMLSLLDWRFLRHQSQIRLNITLTDSIESLDTYAQALRDITLQSDPYNIVWPTAPF